MRVAMLLFPRLTQLDLTGPYEVLSRAPGAQVDLVAATREPVASENGLAIVPTTTFADAPPCDLLFVPGGPGVNEAMLDEATIAFLRRQAEGARFVTSVCTGALVLGAAGLLDGYEATTHWASMEFLPAFGARPVKARFHIDRNRITGGGVTAGIDFALFVVAQLHGEATAKSIQLAIEYAPAPPFESGTPDVADAETLERARKTLEPMLEERRQAVEKARLSSRA